MVKMEELAANIRRAFSNGKNAVAYVDIANIDEVDAHSLEQIYRAMGEAGMPYDNFPVYLGSGYTDEDEIYNPIEIGLAGSKKGSLIYDVLCISPSNYKGKMSKDLKDLINIVPGLEGVKKDRLKWYKESRDTLMKLTEARLVTYARKVGPVLFILDKDAIDDRYGEKNARAVLEQFAARVNGVAVG